MNSHIISFRGLSLIGVVLFACGTGCAQGAKDANPPRTGSISGHVLINNKAAANVEIGAFGGADSFNRRVATAQVKTDTEGYYRLNGLPAGNYQVATFTPNMIPAEVEPQFPLGFGSFNSSKTVLLAAGEDVAEIDLKLKRGGVITGRVTDADEKPIVEERVNLQPVVENGQPAARPPLPSTLMYLTDDRGVYRIYGLPAGRYRVSVGLSAAAQGLVPSATGFYELTYHPDTTDVSRATQVEVTEGGEATSVDIKLGHRKDTHTISGRVIDAENGLPISGARIGVMVMREQAYTAGTIAATSADGTFTLNGLTGGRYGIYVTSENTEGDVYSDPVPVTVTDEDVADVEVKALHGVSISGTVVGDNMPLKDLMAQVGTLRVSANVMPLDGRMTASTIRSSGGAWVAPDGSFTITGLRPGRASLGISARDSSKRPALVKVTAGGIGVTQGFEIERGQPVSGVQLVVTYGTGVIKGAITFQGGTLNDYGTQVSCRRDARTFSGGAFVDARGHFTITGLAPGTYNCEIMFMPGMTRPTTRPPQVPHQTVPVANDSETELNFLVDLTPKGVQP